MDPPGKDTTSEDKGKDEDNDMEKANDSQTASEKEKEKEKEKAAQKAYPDFQYGPPVFLQQKKQNLLALAGVENIGIGGTNQPKGLNLKHLTS